MKNPNFKNLMLHFWDKDKNTVVYPLVYYAKLTTVDLFIDNLDCSIYCQPGVLSLFQAICSRHANKLAICSMHQINWQSALGT